MQRKGRVILIYATIFALLIFPSCSSNSPLIFQNLRQRENLGNEGCKSPTGLPGRCISLLECPSLKIILEGGFNRERIKFLQLSTCKLVGEDPYVCCTDAVAAEESAIIENAIENHRNIELLPRKCGEPYRSDRIVGGMDASIGEYPWMALLSFKDASGSQFGCGGSLISKRYVLTAAHCVTGLPAGWQVDFVRLGELDLRTTKDCGDGICSEPVQDIKIHRVIVHKNYNVDKKHENDIALLRLEREAQLNNFLQPICLPRGKPLYRNLTTSKTVTVAGWGRLHWQLTNRADILQYVTVPVLDNKKCGDIYKSYGLYGGSRFCAGGEKGKDSCNGDSGGPIMDVVLNNNEEKIYQYGVVSLGPSNCGGMAPGLYTNVTYYMAWILDNMEP